MFPQPEGERKPNSRLRSIPIERAVTCISKHRFIIAHFDEAHFDQGPEIIGADRRQFCPIGFEIQQHPAKMDRPFET